MAQRLDLQTLLEGFADHVYYQPPENIRMQFPCITYARDGVSTDHADNVPYRLARRYQVTVVDRDPDSELTDKVEALKYVSFERFFAADDLNHFVFTLYF